MNKIRVVVYSHDTFGLGHISRARKLSRAILLALPSNILIITGTAAHEIISFENGIDIIKLPSLKSIENQNELDYESYCGIDPEICLEIRKKIILETVKSYNPNLFFVDFSPKGIRSELLDTLEFLRKNTSCKIYLTMRDILDDPEVSIRKWKRRDYYNVIDSYYDRLLVFGDKTIFDFAKAYSIPSKTKRKILYMGYMIDLEERERNIGNKRDDYVVVTAGGGRDGFVVIDRVSMLIDEIKYIIAGPYMPDDEFARLRERFSESVVLRKSSDILDLMSRAKYCVTMCGYNTFCEIIQSGAPTITIPREFPEKEQLIRSSIFSRMSMFESIRRNDLSDDTFSRKRDKVVKAGAKIINFNCSYREAVKYLLEEDA
jgi:predicted glycosyltransferase